MLTLYTPKLEELWFLKDMLADEETMSFNKKYGGTIDFPESKWEAWYDKWVANDDGKRFHAYLKDEEKDEFVGECAYYYNDEEKNYIVDIKVHAKHRGNGYGIEGLNLLCQRAKNDGIKEIYDNIAIDNPSVNMFLKNGFTEVYRNDEIVIVKKVLD